MDPSGRRPTSTSRPRRSGWRSCPAGRTRFTTRGRGYERAWHTRASPTPGADDAVRGGVSRGRCGSTRSSPTASPRRTSSAGCSRPACLHSNGRRARHRGRGRADRRRARPRATTGSTAAGSDPKDLYGWQANRARPADAAARPRAAAGSSRRTGTRRWAGSSRRSRELLDATRRLGRIGFYTTGQLFLEEYYTLARDRQGGHRHAAHGRQHPAVHRHRGGGAEGDLRHRRAARLLRRRRPLRRDRAAAATTSPRRRPCCGCGCSTAGAARTRRRMLCVDPRATPVAREADVHLAPRVGTNLALLNGLLRELIERGWVDAAYVDAHTLGFDELRATVEPLHARAGRRDLRRRRRATRARPPSCSAPASGCVSTVLQGFYQSNQATAAACQVNNLHLLRGMIGRPGRRRPADERPADRAEHPRDRRRRRPAGLPQLGQRRRTSASWPSCGTSTPTTIPHWAPPTHAMQIFRYAEQGSIELLWISATNPAVSLPDLARIRRILAQAGAVRRRAGPLPDRDRRARRRRAAGGDLGREDRHVHQRRPHRAPLRARRSSRPARRAPTSTSSSTTRGGWTSATATASR